MALALLTILLRHRDGWDITLADIGRRYGYGEDAMAGAMGLLQVARYVVKVRVMQREGNQWRTEMAVYDTPATDEDVADLLAAISEEEPDARRIEVIPPTKTALDRAAKRRKKILPRLREIPDSGPTWENAAKPQVAPDSGVPRDSGDPGVTKKTVSKKTTEDSSRPSVRKAEVSRVNGSQTDGGTDGGSGSGEFQDESPVPAGGGTPSTPSSPGVDLLVQLGTEHPDRMLAGYGTALRDVGLLADGRLAEGWSRETLWALLAAPLPQPLTHTPAAILATRLRKLPSTPPAGPVPQLPAQPTGPTSADQRPAHVPPQPPRCGCGELATVPGSTPRCPGCAGWPACDGGCGRRLPPPGGTCDACEYATWPECEGGCGQHLPQGGTCDACVYAASMAVEPAPDGTCAGQGQYRDACGRPVRAYGMCLRCLNLAEKERKRCRDEDWESAVAAAAAAVATEQQGAV